MPISLELGTDLRGPAWRVYASHGVGEEQFFPARLEGLSDRRVTQKVLISAKRSKFEYYPVMPEEAKKLLDGLLGLAQRRLEWTPTRFADRFGFMGYNRLVPAKNRCHGGEPIPWLLAHAHTIFVVTILIDLVVRAQTSSDARSELKKYLWKELPQGPFAAGGAVYDVRLRRHPSDDRSPILHTNHVLRILLNPNLAGKRSLQVEESGVYNIFELETPIQAAYWYLADQINKLRPRKCPECGRLFLGGKDKFCPPEEGKSISKCKSRYNVRRFRNKGRRRRKS